MTGFSWKRMWAILRKEFFQMRRDPTSIGMMLVIPLIQLVLFGFAINTNPKELPTVLVSSDHSVLTRTFVSAMENTGYFKIEYHLQSLKDADNLMAEGKALFVIVIPPDFTSRFYRQDNPEILMQADATDSVAVSSAISAMQSLMPHVFDHLLTGSLAHLKNPALNVNYVVHAKYNPDAITAFNIVPALMGVVLTMTLVTVTSVAVTREYERGTMETLLVMPIKPLEVMIGKILPYVIVGYAQMILIILSAIVIFHVPIQGSIPLLFLAALPFIAANLSIGLTFSSIAKNQLQAMQMSFFFFLPSILLSGFMFPFYGMPHWAQAIGHALPLMYFIRIIRGIILKGNTVGMIWPDIWPILVIMIVVMMIALRQYRRTLD